MDTELTIAKKIRKAFKQDPVMRLLAYVILFFGLVAVFADFLANEKPLVAKVNGKICFPILQSKEWNHADYEFAVFPPVPYLPNNIDLKNIHGASPFEGQHVASLRWRHWLGTDELGRDVLAGLIHGTRVAFFIGIFSVLLSSFIGLVFGSFAGYFGDEGLKVSVAGLIVNFVFIFLGIFYGFGMRKYVLMDALSDSIYNFMTQLVISLFISGIIIFLGNRLIPILARSRFLKRKIALPLDIIISRVMEIFMSVPVLFLILCIASLAKPSLLLTAFLISMTMWTGVARFVRAELLRIRELAYIESAKTLGLSHFRVLVKHALPNAITPVIITMAFGVAVAILTESGLSFLGIGVSPGTVTWGSILSAARETPQSWWVAVFPGSMIFLAVMCFNILGDRLNQLLDPKRNNAEHITNNG